MPRSPTSDDWKERVKTLVANERQLSGRSIHRLFEAEAKDGTGRLDYPSQRTIERIIKEFRTPGAQAPYRFFSWPKTMQDRFLPWEASRFAIELAARYQRFHPGKRATNGYVRWHWRLSLAWPPAYPLIEDASMDERDHLVAVFLINEATEKPIPSGAEQVIAHHLQERVRAAGIPDYDSEDRDVLAVESHGAGIPEDVIKAAEAGGLPLQPEPLYFGEEDETT
jgi:hypothetical protein